MVDVLVLLIGIFISSFIVIMYLLLFIIPLRTGAPYVPSNPEIVKKMIELADLGPGKIAVDLGSGDGRIVLAIAATGAEAHGFEISTPLISLSNSKIKKLGLTNAKIFKKNFWNEDLSMYDAIFMYQLPSVMRKIEPKFLSNLKPSAVVVSNSFSIKNWQPFSTEKTIFAYRVKDNLGKNINTQPVILPS